MPFSFLAGSNGLLMGNICFIKVPDAALTITREEKRKQTQSKGRKYKEQMKDSVSIAMIYLVSQADVEFCWIRHLWWTCAAELHWDPGCLPQPSWATMGNIEREFPCKWSQSIKPRIIGVRFPDCKKSNKDRKKYRWQINGTNLIPEDEVHCEVAAV